VSGDNWKSETEEVIDAGRFRSFASASRAALAANHFSASDRSKRPEMCTVVEGSA
jgi:hypothetical protein